MSRHYSDPSRETEPHSLPDVETFYMTAGDLRLYIGTDGSVWDDMCTADMPPRAPDDAEEIAAFRTAWCKEHAGWYWWACFPGCMPDSEPSGPFALEADALADAQEGAE